MGRLGAWEDDDGALGRGAGVLAQAAACAQGGIDVGRQARGGEGQRVGDGAVRGASGAACGGGAAGGLEGGQADGARARSVERIGGASGDAGRGVAHVAGREV